MNAQPDNDTVLLAHGGGGELTRRLLAERVLPRLANPLLDPLGDSAVLEFAGVGRLCFTTDSYVVQPLFFPGGDIGRLAVCGTVNDLAVMGAQPLALSLAMVIEEGLPLATLERVIESIATASAEAGVPIATGDTKVIERRGGDGLILTTAGVGALREDVNLSSRRIVAGDAIVVTGRIGDHGLAVMSAREGLAFRTELVSDAAPLNGLIAALLDGADAPIEAVKFLRDPTRGGLAGVVADLCEETGLAVELEEEAIPVSPTARHTAEMLGLDPLTIANEGKVVCVVSAEYAGSFVAACRRHPLGTHAGVVGRFTDDEPALVEMVTRGGGRRLIQRPYGEDLPRIC